MPDILYPLTRIHLRRSGRDLGEPLENRVIVEGWGRGGAVWKGRGKGEVGRGEDEGMDEEERVRDKEDRKREGGRRGRRDNHKFRVYLTVVIRSDEQLFGGGGGEGKGQDKEDGGSRFFWLYVISDSTICWQVAMALGFCMGRLRTV